MILPLKSSVQNAVTAALSVMSFHSMLGSPSLTSSAIQGFYKFVRQLSVIHGTNFMWLGMQEYTVAV